MKTKSTAKLAAAFAVIAALPGCDGLFGNKAANTGTAPLAVSEEGIARSCTVSPIDLAANANATATMAMSNEGGWCALRLTEKDGQPFATGLVHVRPEHGRILIEKNGGKTLVEYYPTTGYTGADTFTVALRSRTANAADATVKVAMTVAR